MNGSVLIYIGSLLPLGWGIAHLFPTRAIVRGFGEISADNKRILLMEWIHEGVSLIFIGFLVGLVTAEDRAGMASRTVYWASFGVLNIFSLVSLFTGFKHPHIPFKLCPFIFSGSSC